MAAAAVTAAKVGIEIALVAGEMELFRRNSRDGWQCSLVGFSLSTWARDTMRFSGPNNRIVRASFSVLWMLRDMFLKNS